MSPRLPSLTALRTFEAAARNKSFKAAAAELSVTPAAVGFQIKRLEDELGAALFVRKHREVELTDVGQKLAYELRPAFDAIGTAWRDLSLSTPSPSLRITAPAHAVSEWLIPATAARQAKDPGPKVRWDVSRRKRDLYADEWDAAVRYSMEPDDRYFCEPILRPWFLPLARPEVARLIRQPKDLLKQGLITVEFGLDTPDGYTAWPAYLKLLGLPTEVNFAMTCMDTPLATQMALETDLVAIGFPSEKHLASGRLVYPIKKAILPRSRNWFMCAKGRENTDEMLWVRSALHSGARRLRELVDDVQMFELDGSPIDKTV